jgi:Amidohydrolase family
MGGSIALVGVNVAPFDTPQVLTDQTVIIRGDRIARIGDRRSVTTGNVDKTVAGHHRFVMPGLADMHCHLWCPADLRLYPSFGVTTIRNMWGGVRIRTWRDEARRGTYFGPTLYTTGPILDGDPPIWKDSTALRRPEEARREVAREKRAGFDFIKVYNRLRPDVYKALVAAAKRAGLPVVGHVPDAVGLEAALKAGQRSIEHLTGYFPFLETEDSPFRGKLDPISKVKSLDFLDESKIPDAVRKTRAAGTWNCVTLVVASKFVAPELARRLLDRPEMRYVPPETMASWRSYKEDIRIRGQNSKFFQLLRRGDAVRQRLTDALYRGGAPLLLGTDAPNPFVVPGFAIHEELSRLVEAGLTPFDAISAGTRESARFLGASTEFGTVEEGKRADLLLVDGNPLEDVSAASRIHGVALRGRWLPAAEIQEMLDTLAASYQPTVDPFDVFPPLEIAGAPFRAGTFKIHAGITSVGTERFAWVRGATGTQLLSEQVIPNPPERDLHRLRPNCAPDGTPRQLDFEAIWAAGSSQIRMVRKEGVIWTTVQQPDGTTARVEKRFPRSGLLGSPLVASYLPLVHRLRTVAPGRSLRLPMMACKIEPEFAVEVILLTAKRSKPPRKSAHKLASADIAEFEVEEKWRSGTTSSTFLVDLKRELVLSIKTQLQLGSINVQLAA